MPKDFLDSFLSIGGFLLGLGTALIGIVGFFAQSATKKYAAQRDFQHLQRNYEQLAKNQETILNELEERADRLQNALERQQLLLNLVLGQVAGNDKSVGTMLKKLDSDE